MKRIALVANGHLPIPPVGWGAVEAIIWDVATRLRARGHDVVIVNVGRRKAPFVLLREHLRKPFDWVHVHDDRSVASATLAGRLAGFPVVATGHGPHGRGPDHERRVLRQFMRLAKARYHVALTNGQRDGILTEDPSARVAVLGNGTDTDAIRFHPGGNGRAICLGRVSERKRQADVARLLGAAGVPLDIVGPDPDGLLGEIPRLGEWDRATMQARLGEWSALVLLSTAEAHPLVVMEALAAGVPVVVSPEAAENLDVARPFVRVVSADEDLADAVRSFLDDDPEVRREAREYAVARYDYENWLDVYLTTVEGFLGR